MSDKIKEVLRTHTDAELSALYGHFERRWLRARDEKLREEEKAMLDEIAAEQDRRHPGFYTK